MSDRAKVRAAIEKVMAFIAPLSKAGAPLDAELLVDDEPARHELQEFSILLREQLAPECEDTIEETIDAFTGCMLNHERKRGGISSLRSGEDEPIVCVNTVIADACRLILDKLGADVDPPKRGGRAR